MEFPKMMIHQIELQPDKIYSGQNSLVIDIENLFVSEVEIRNQNEFKYYKNLENFDRDYIMYEDQLYKIRPHTYDFLRAMVNFFELIVFTPWSKKKIDFIINHLERVLNMQVQKAVDDSFSQFEEEEQKECHSFYSRRLRNKPQNRVYFQFILNS